MTIRELLNLFYIQDCKITMDFIYQDDDNQAQLNINDDEKEKNKVI